MSIKVGDKIPNVDLTIFTESGPTTLSTAQVLGSGKAVLFAVPGAFTPTCSDYHLPSYVVRNEDLRAKGVGTIACLSVNDPFVMSAWAKDQNVGDSITMLPDGNGAFTKALGLEMDGSGFGLGTRSQRFAIIIEDGVVTSLFIEENPAGIEMSGAENVLAAL